MQLAQLSENFDFVVIGGAALHLVLGGGTAEDGFHLREIIPSIGGPAGSVAAQLAAGGGRVLLGTVIGRDAMGSALRQLITESAVELYDTGEATETSVVVTWTSSGVLTAIARPGESSIGLESGLPRLGSGRFYVSSFPGWQQWLEQAPPHSVVTDIGFAPHLGNATKLAQELGRVGPHASAVFVSGAGLTASDRRALWNAAESVGLPVLVVTNGADDAEAMISGKLEKVVVKTNAHPEDVMSAGDAVVAGYMEAVAGGLSPLDAIKRGIDLASAKVAVLGQRRETNGA